VSYRPALTGRAFGQFSDLLRDRPDAYAALATRLTRLVDEPWDAWQVQPGGGEPEFRETQFGEHGILSFRVDDETETLIIFNILWIG
jgi:hypothetical protein